MTDHLELLKRVKLGASTKDLVPLQSCFYFYEGRVQSQNGSMCIDAPCDLFTETIAINAAKFWKAASLTKCQFKYAITKGGKLSLQRNKFRALIPMLDADKYPKIEVPQGEDVVYIEVQDLLKTIRRLRPFISDDASRPWSRAILFRNSYAYATNNVVLARLPVPLVREISIPLLAIDVLLELGLEPLSINVTSKAITFELPGDLWLVARLSEIKWPSVENIIVPSIADDLPDYFAETIENLIPFCEDSRFPLIVMGEFGISTSQGLSEATMDIGEFPEALFRAEPLLLVARNAYAVAFESYPKPCYFEGEDDLDGMIIGLNKK